MKRLINQLRYVDYSVHQWGEKAQIPKVIIKQNGRQFHTNGQRSIRKPFVAWIVLQLDEILLKKENNSYYKRIYQYLESPTRTRHNKTTNGPEIVDGPPNVYLTSNRIFAFRRPMLFVPSTSRGLSKFPVPYFFPLNRLPEAFG